MLSLITKKGEIESKVCSLGGFDNSRQHTMSLGLIFLSSVSDKVHREGMEKGLWRDPKEIVEKPQDARKWIGKASSKKTLHLTL